MAHRFSMQTSPLIEIIVVTYNCPKLAALTVEAIGRNTVYPNWNLTVHRNAPGHHLSTCWNELIERSAAPYICLLNPDTIPTTGWLMKLMDVAQRPEICAVSPSSNLVYMTQVEGDAPAQATYNPDTLNTFAATLGNEVTMGYPSLSAMCTLFARVDWKAAGQFDERFPLYGEDVEFFWRLAKHTDLQLAWAHGSYVHHFKGQCVGKALREPVNGGIDIPAARAYGEKLVNQLTDLEIRHI